MPKKTHMWVNYQGDMYLCSQLWKSKIIASAYIFDVGRMLLEHDRKRKCTDSCGGEKGGPNSLESGSVGYIPEGCPLMTHTPPTRLLPSQHCRVSKPSVHVSWWEGTRADLCRCTAVEACGFDKTL